VALPALASPARNCSHVATATLELSPTLLGWPFGAPFASKVKVQFPLQVCRVAAPKLIGPNEHRWLAVDVRNVSLAAYGGAAGASRGTARVVFDVPEAWRDVLKFGDPHQNRCRAEDAITSPNDGYTLFVDFGAIEPGAVVTVEVLVECHANCFARLFETATWTAALVLRDVAVEAHEFPLRLVPEFRFDVQGSCDVLVTSPEVGRDDFLTWAKVLPCSQAFSGVVGGGFFNVWDVQRYQGFAATSDTDWVSAVGPGAVVAIPCFAVGRTPAGGCSAQVLRATDLRRFLAAEPSRSILLVNAEPRDLDHLALDAAAVAAVRRAAPAKLEADAAVGDDARALAAVGVDAAGCQPCSCCDGAAAERNTRRDVRAMVMDRSGRSEGDVLGAYVASADEWCGCRYRGVGAVFESPLPRALFAGRVANLRTGRDHLFPVAGGCGPHGEACASGATVDADSPFGRALVGLLALRPAAVLCGKRGALGSPANFEVHVAEPPAAGLCGRAADPDAPGYEDARAPEASTLAYDDVLAALLRHKLRVGTLSLEASRGGGQGRTRERNSQLQRLLSRPFSTRFG